MNIGDEIDFWKYYGLLISDRTWELPNISMHPEGIDPVSQKKAPRMSLLPSCSKR